MAKLKTDRRNAGYSYPEKTRIPFVVARYLPISTIVKKLGPLRHVIEVNGPGQAFKPGRSGSLWVVANQVTSLQHGGLKPSYQRGWGQSLEAILTWCVAQIAAINHIPPSHVDLRLIRII